MNETTEKTHEEPSPAAPINTVAGLDGHVKALSARMDMAAVKDAAPMPFTSVHMLLITGTNKGLQQFYAMVHGRLNCLERRHNTFPFFTEYYTCLSADRQMAVDAAEYSHVTMQEIKRADDAESYEIVVDNGAAWPPAQGGQI